MKNLFLSLGLLLNFLCKAQLPAGTDIFLTECKFEKGKSVFLAPINITNRAGYDNQPSFSEDGQFIFYSAVKENNQADIFYYSIPQKTTTRITNTSESEYSPRVSQDEKYISVVRVERDSSQRFRKFSFDNFVVSAICNSIDSIGYYNWTNDSTFIFFKITEPPSLWLSEVRNCGEKFLASKVGRCIQPVSKEEVFFTQVIDSTRWICRLNLKSFKVDKMFACLKGSEDFIVYNETNFIMASGAKLFKYNSKKSKTWEELVDFSAQSIKNIKRISISKDATKIAFVNDSQTP